MTKVYHLAVAVVVARSTLPWHDAAAAAAAVGVHLPTFLVAVRERCALFAVPNCLDLWEFWTTAQA